MRNYQTEQRKLLLAFFAEHPDRQFTIDVLESSIQGVSRSALYRNINQMEKEGLVQRFPKEGSRKFLYQYIGSRECAGHFHLKCGTCGSIFHMDNASSEALVVAVRKGSNFNLDQSKTMLIGYCSSCK